MWFSHFFCRLLTVSIISLSVSTICSVSSFLLCSVHGTFIIRLHIDISNAWSTPRLASLDDQNAGRPNWSHTKESHRYHLYMHTRYALCKCHICSRPFHYVRPQGSTVLSRKFSIPLYSLLPLYVVFFLPLETNYHHSPTSSLKIPPVSLPEQKSISPFSRMP